MNIGHIQVNQPICLAPMEDVTDMPFRLICKRLGADLVYTEFTSSEALIRGIKRAESKIKVCDEERPVAIQLFGGLEESMEKAAGIAESFKPDFIDINCGCWVKNHVARGEGAALLKDLPRFEKIVRSTVKGTKLPVTVKTRLGWDEESIVILDVARMIEQTGAKALAIHCRTRSQAHEGEAQWNWLEKVKKVTSLPIIANGDIKTPEDVKFLFEMGCDGVMIGREAIANPWLFKQAKHYLKTGTKMALPTIKDKIEVCKEHVALAVQLEGPRASIPFRKHYAGYLRGLPNVSKLRSDLMGLIELEKIIERLNRYVDEHSDEKMPILV
jgi:tRNA-dihydrouridine synthase B